MIELGSALLLEAFAGEVTNRSIAGGSSEAVAPSALPFYGSLSRLMPIEIHGRRSSERNAPGYPSHSRTAHPIRSIVSPRINHRS